MDKNKQDNILPIMYGLSADMFTDNIETPVTTPIDNISLYDTVADSSVGSDTPPYYNNFIAISNTRVFKVDFEKVKTLEDVKLILEAIQIGFNINFCENYEKFSELEKLLLEVK